MLIFAFELIFFGIVLRVYHVSQTDYTWVATGFTGGVHAYIHYRQDCRIISAAKRIVIISAADRPVKAKTALAHHPQTNLGISSGTATGDHERRPLLREQTSRICPTSILRRRRRRPSSIPVKSSPRWLARPCSFRCALHQSGPGCHSAKADKSLRLLLLSRPIPPGQHGAPTINMAIIAISAFQVLLQTSAIL